MSGLYTQIPVSIEILSPVHIGDGGQLDGQIDYVVHRGRTWVVDQGVVLERTLSDEGLFDNTLLGRPIDELLHETDFEDHQVFRYVMEGHPTYNFVRTHIKTVWGQPYVPGSTLKGVLRTLLVWGWYAAQPTTPDLGRLGKSRSWAAQSIERDVMGQNPNEDIFRAFRVSDSVPVEMDRLTVVPVSIYPTAQRGRTGKGVVVDVETLRPGTQFESTITVEEYGFENEDAQKRLGWQDKRMWFDRIARFGQVFGGRRLAQEVEYFQNRSDLRGVLGFYSRLVQIHNQLEPGQFLAQIGWGAGWNSKTLNDLLMSDDQKFARLVRDYRLTRFSDKFRQGQMFPSSRHLTPQNLPVGWVRVTMG